MFWATVCPSSGAAWCYSLVLVCALAAGRLPTGRAYELSHTQETLSKTHYTLENSRTTGHRSKQFCRNTLIKTTTHVTTNHSPLNKDVNVKTFILTEQYNTWNKSTVSRKLLKMVVLTFETCCAVNSEIIKRVTSSWSIFIQLSRWCTVQ